MTGIEATENDESRGYWEPLGENQSPALDQKAPRLFEAIKTLFKEVKNLLTATVTSKKPIKRRKGDEESRGAFRLLALKITRKVVSSIFDPSRFWGAPDPVDEWQRLDHWHQNNQQGECSHEHSAFHHEPQDYLSLDL